MTKEMELRWAEDEHLAGGTVVPCCIWLSKY